MASCTLHPQEMLYYSGEQSDLNAAELKMHLPSVWRLTRLAVVMGFVAAVLSVGRGGGQETASGSPGADPQNDFGTFVQPLMGKFCLDCHSAKAKKGELDLERFRSIDVARKDLKPWQLLVEQLEAGEMPPKDKAQPTTQERKRLIAWARQFLDTEAKARAGDPGPAKLRRLSNAEYDYTVRDLTGIDFRPTREFPADGAAGEGFTNAAEALSMPPTLVNKFLNAAKDLADHAVLLPDGFRFSPAKTRRDWTNECLAALRQFYSQFTSDGRLPLKPYLTATIRYREDLAAGTITLDSIAAKEKLNPNYLRILWRTLTDKDHSFPLDKIRVRWREAATKDVDSLLADVSAWQKSLWKFVRVGSYRDGNTIRQVANDPAVESLKLDVKDIPSHKQLLSGFAEFRACFPQFICYPRIVPEDEDVCLKLYHREDQHLMRLFLDDEQTHRLEQLWQEHRFITQWPIVESKNLPLFIQFVTQDQPKELLVYFQGKIEPFRIRAEDFEKELEAAAPKQLETLLDFAARAYRRPLTDKEKAELLALYRTLRMKDVPHEDAFRGVLTRVLVSPSFLFRLEQAPAGKAPAPVNDWELASRLSYFLWSTLPDEELRRTAASGQLHDPTFLKKQALRMLKDDRVRALGVEFGTQWLHVRGFSELNEKNEKLFPSFDEKLRRAIDEESILFFQDLFQSDRSFAQVLDADYTFVNETLAKHYGIPGVAGPQWRRVDGVKKYGRGGILGLASVQAKEAGASRTSPVLRGNWVVETLLGEKLPRPPANVPRLPEEEGNDGLTMRQLVEKHARVAECAVCHQRIDPFGFALEKYDAIGRLRDKDLGGLAVDAKVRLKDGTEFEGIDGLRDYLLNKKKDVVVRLFCRRLLGYALGRAVGVADQPLIDEMAAELNKSDGHLSAAVLTIVASPQFRAIRGSGFVDND
jgi:Protein of unknown function (DUF1592)/Protein of unknown function (DUF1588)/Protein of unknown function (DUF1587)/Protein of unknown function (DUF1585)/Protein of unknown function (DUF1595)/Planctomycete cytochrome C